MIKIKSLNEDDTGVFEGTANKYDLKDRDGDIIRPGAFSKSIANRKTYPLLLNHSWDNVIGKIDVHEEEDGLKAVGTFNLKDPQAVNIYELVKMGALTDMSVGFRLKDYVPIDPKKPYGGFEIKEADLYEVSIVVAPSNVGSTINNIKSKPKTTKFRLGGFEYDL